MAPRLDPKSPGELAKLEAKWITETYGVRITAAQVRAVLSYHSEFQKSDARREQRETAAAARAEAKAAEAAARAERMTASAAEKAAKLQAEADRMRAIAEGREKPRRSPGRPRKTQTEAPPIKATRGRPRKAATETVTPDEVEETPKPKRGRPRKAAETGPVAGSAAAKKATVKSTRPGRPRRAAKAVDVPPPPPDDFEYEQADPQPVEEPAATVTPIKRKRRKPISSAKELTF